MDGWKTEKEMKKERTAYHQLYMPLMIIFLYMSVNIISTPHINVLEENYILFTEEVPLETRTCREVDRPGGCEAKWGRLLFY